MAWLDKVKDALDWGKRGQFVIWVVMLLCTAAWWKAAVQVVRLTVIPAGWHAPIYLFSSAIFLLLLLSGYVWWVYRKPSPDESRKALEDVMRQGAHAALYDYLSNRARDLLRDLEILWHNWHNAGEKLVHPLDGTLDKLNDYSSDKAMTLLNERRDFLVLYSHHLTVVRLEFPEFKSRTMDGGYPSDREYVEVRDDLVAHVKELERMTKKTWSKYGLPLER